MGGLESRIRRLEGGYGTGACPECGVAPGESIEFIICTRDELGEGPDEEQCLTCGWPKTFTFNIQHANAQDFTEEG